MSDLERRLDALSPQRRALLAKRLAAAPRPAKPGRVAVVGAACRLPGGIRSADAFWQRLCEGFDAVSEVPPERWDAARLYDPDPTTPGTMSSRWGSFLEDIESFDPTLFGISPREAAGMDPQHRVLLEVAWDALDDAGLPRETLTGSKTGVFVSVYQRDFSRLSVMEPTAIDAYTASGTHHSIAANRLSYVFDLRGPSVVVDTACSSSLVAVHLACKSLALGECDRAIVGAANLMLAPEETMSLSRWGMLAADGRCKTFDARADGFVRGEGCVVLVLERGRGERTARGARAVIRGSAVNQDGRSNGLTAPNAKAQEAVIRAALEDAGLPGSRVGFVETHGTGTSLGDPIEVEALASFYGREAPCVLGAVKTNLGHLEAAAGLVGLLKAVLAVEHGTIPPNLHYRSGNRSIDWEATQLRVADRMLPWRVEDEPRAAAVSAFGMGGTNAHVVLEHADASTEEPERRTGPWIVPLSACSPAALRCLAEDVAQAASEMDADALGSMAQGLARRRSALEHRLAPCASDGVALAERLRAWLSGDAPELAAGRHRSLRPVFVFPGQGSQWQGMGLSLLDVEPAFTEALRECDAIVQRLAGWSVIAALRGDAQGPGLDRIDAIQPLIFSIQVAVAAQWRAWGIEPAAVIGHSMGEVAATHVSGALSLEDAATVLVRRSALMARLTGTGTMLAVAVGEERAAALAESAGADVTLAVVNGPEATVLAGSRDALAPVAERLEAEGVRTQWIPVDVASHSPAVDGLRDELLEAIAGITPRVPTVPVYSTVLGRRLEGAEVTPAYWFENLRAPVRFGNAVGLASSDGLDAFIEISTHPILLPAICAGVDGELPLRVASGRRNGDERAEMLMSLAELFAAGASVNWAAVVRGPWSRSWLPPTPWQRQSFAIPRGSVHGAGPHPLLGPELELADPEGARVWTTSLDLRRAPYLADHTVEGIVLMPGTGMLEMMLAAAREAAPGPVRVVDLRLERPLFLGEDGPRVQVVWSPSGSEAEVRIASRGPEDGTWTLHASARCIRGPVEPPAIPSVPDGPRESGESFYARLAATGNTWGPAFRGVTSVVATPSRAVAEIRVPSSVAGQLGRYVMHPAVLDACGQALSTAAGSDGGGGPFVMVRIDEVQVFGPAAPALWSRIDVEHQGPSELSGDVTVWTDDGRPVARIKGLRIRFLEAGRAVPRPEDSIHEVEWVEASVPSGSPPRALRVVGDGGALDQALVAHADAQGSSASLESEVPTDFTGADVVVLATDEANVQGTLDAERATLRCHRALLAFERARPGDRVWLVTRGGAPGLHASSPVGAAVWGLARSLEVERPEVFGGVVDLDPRASAIDAARALWDRLGASAEPQLAWRGDGWRAPRIGRPRAATERRAWRSSPSSTVLVTGGLGALGSATAGRLVERGARHLLLVGRTGLPARARWSSQTDPDVVRRIEEIRQLESKGAQVEVAAVDVSDADAMQRLAERWRAELRPPVRGVVHAAGVQHPAVAAETTAQDLARDLAPKLAGAHHLHAAFPELEWAILYSSGASVLGSPLLASYAAANAALDAMSDVLAARGIETLAVGWGAWEGGGMATRYEREHNTFTATGMGQMSPEVALDALERAWAGGHRHVLVLPIDWAQWAERHPAAATAPLVQGMVQGARVDDEPQASRWSRDALAPLRGGARTEALEAYVRRSLGVVLRTAATSVDLDLAPVRCGLDSLMAVELRNRVADELSVTLPIVEILRARSGHALVTRLDEGLTDVEDWEDWTI